MDQDRHHSQPYERAPSTISSSSTATSTVNPEDFPSVATTSHNLSLPAQARSPRPIPSTLSTIAETASSEAIRRPRARDSTSKYTFYREGTPSPPPSTTRGRAESARLVARPATGASEPLGDFSFLACDPPSDGSDGEGRRRGNGRGVYDLEGNDGGRGEKNGDEEGGMSRKKVIVIIVTILLIVCVAVGVGVGVGVGLKARRNGNSNSPIASSETTEPSSTSSIQPPPSTIPSDSLSDTSVCPETNNTIYTVPSTEIRFLRQCGLDFGPGQSIDLGQVQTHNMTECIHHCAEFPGCTGCSFGYIAGDVNGLSRCWLKRGMLEPHYVRGNWSFAFLQ